MKTARFINTLMAVVLCASGGALHALEKVSITRDTLWLNHPAEYWHNGYPVGNGRMGTMVQGHLNELFVINEDTIYPKQQNRDVVGAYKHMDKLKQLIQDEKYLEANEFGAKHFIPEDLNLTGNPKGGTALVNNPACHLKLNLHSGKKTSSYRRLMEMDKGIVSVEYAQDGIEYLREHFSSNPDQVLAIRIKADRENALSGSYEITGFTNMSYEAVDDMLLFSDESGKDGVKFTGAIRVETKGGSSAVGDAGISFKGADEVLLYLTIGTDYSGDKPRETALARQRGIKGKGYEAIKAAHVADFSSFYKRVDLKLGKESAPDAMPTDKLIAKQLENGYNALLAYQVLQISRYNLISSSRAGTMPAHLHCIWNRQFNPSYNCAYIINVNVELNYSITEVGNLSELSRPLFDFMDALRPNGRITAREMYNHGGFVVHHNVDGTLQTGPMFRFQSGFWLMGAGWLSQNMWEHWLHTHDKEWLARQGYPILKESAEFFYDYLMKNPDSGKLIFGPSTSPENHYLTPEGEDGFVMTGLAMDQQIVRDHFTNTIEAARVLGEEDAFIGKLKKALANLEKTQIGEDGRVLEWRRPLPEKEIKHRHVSHLYGLYPAALFTEEKNTDLYKASEKSLDVRWAARDKEKDGPAWGVVTNMPMYARLKRLDDAYRMYEKVFENGYVRETLMGTLSPKNNKNSHGVYLDSNSGTSMGMMETLMQSHQSFIEFLPAVPKAWKTGSFEGMLARGNFEIDLEWEKGKWTRAEIVSRAGATLRLKAAKGTKVLEGGKPVKVKRDKSGVIELPTTKGKTYTLLSAQTKSGFSRFMRVINVFDTVSYVSPDFVSILVVRKCHDIDLPNSDCCVPFFLL